ncbi:vesicle coat protein [Endogone sp. FLAS-F59071]|nr:vesicle coat protein [Endogone sp. FLAS-F59071]|eukprot:RUS12746.1 vesicle coat protein [Endogone sp. FLAS-F59071]
MNALCALLHFCENHGPRTVFCTQAFHTKAHPSPPSTPSSTSPCSPTPFRPTTRPNSNGSSSSYHNPHVQSSTAGTSPKDIDASSTKYQGRSPAAPPAPQVMATSSCPACTAQIPFITITNPDGSEWTQEAKGFYTSDGEDENVHYFGSRNPDDPQLYAAVRHACVRRWESFLSIEFCPGRDGPVIFGDDKNGYVLSYMFKLRDSQARGENRFYSFIILMTDRVYLVSCWQFLVG